MVLIRKQRRTRKQSTNKNLSERVANLLPFLYHQDKKMYLHYGWESTNTKSTRTNITCKTPGVKGPPHKRF